MPHACHGELSSHRVPLIAVKVLAHLLPFPHHGDLFEVCVQDFQEEQDLVARLMHRLRSSDPAQHFAMLYTAWERLSVGGVRRLRHTIPPIAFAALHIARQKAVAGSGQPCAQEVIPMACKTVHAIDRLWTTDHKPWDIMRGCKLEQPL